MTYLEHGVTGAKRATWRGTNPRALLEKLINTQPSASEDKWRNAFWDEVEDDKDYLRAIVDYWLDNNIRSLMPQFMREAKAAVRNNQATQAAVSEAKAKIKQRIEYETKVVLLELLMPNNKPLAQCTGAECSRFGGWFTKLASKVPAKKTVGETMSETQVYKLWLSARTKK